MSARVYGTKDIIYFFVCVHEIRTQKITRLSYRIIIFSWKLLQNINVQVNVNQRYTFGTFAEIVTRQRYFQLSYLTLLDVVRDLKLKLILTKRMIYLEKDRLLVSQ